MILTPGWQTQVFMGRKGWGGTSRRRRASLPDASVSMARPGSGFSREVRFTELARIALLDRRPVLSEADVVSMVYGKFENPMLGLYSANILLDWLATDREWPDGMDGSHPGARTGPASAAARQSGRAVR